MDTAAINETTKQLIDTWLWFGFGVIMVTCLIGTAWIVWGEKPREVCRTDDRDCW